MSLRRNKADSTTSGPGGAAIASLDEASGQQIPQPLVAVSKLSKYFPARASQTGGSGAIQAVNEVTFSIWRGETYSVVGESGCGKTTLGRTILQLEKPTGGSVVFDGQELTSLNGQQMQLARRRMQMIFQDPHSSLNPRMTTFKIVEEPLVIHKIGDRRSRAARVVDILERVGLGARAQERYPHEFSGGQRQRIGIARALALNPSFIVCDEPVSSLDVSVQAQVLNLLKQIRRDFGLTLLFISHNLAVVRQFTDRVGVMYLGQLVEEAPREEFFSSARHPYSKALLSAVPVPSPRLEKERRVILLEGDLPSPANPPKGCRFHTRCPFAQDVCRREEPPIEAVSEDHRVACHFWKSI